MPAHLALSPFCTRAGLALALAWCATAAAAQTAAVVSPTLQRLMDVKPAAAEPQLSAVRKTLLMETARRVGALAGLADRSQQIRQEIAQRESALDRRYAFQALIMDAAVLPPVIVQSQNVVSLEYSTMRVAEAIYRIEEPPRFVETAPTWRDWLFLGMPTSDAMADLTVEPDVAPRDAAERAFWSRELAAAYETGRKQADLVFDLNLAQLNRAYDGMRTYYDLYARSMVSAPHIVASTDVAHSEDPNTMAVGATVFRIQVNPRLVTEPQKWVPLGK